MASTAKSGRHDDNSSAVCFGGRSWFCLVKGGSIFHASYRVPSRLIFKGRKKTLDFKLDG